MFSPPISDCHTCPLGAAAPGRCPFTPTHLAPDAVLVGQDERPQNVYFVRDGLAVLRGVSGDGDETSLSVRGPGALLGTEAFQGTRSPQEVRALTDLWVCGLKASEVEAWVGPEGSPARAVVTLLVGELQQRRKDLQLREGGCLARLARYLVMAGGGRTPRPLRKQLVARMLGMRPETLSRSLRCLAERGLLEADGDIRITDLGGLAALAESSEA